MSVPIIILISTAGSFVVSIIAIKLLITLSHRFKWYDDVNHRKIHSGEIPRIGGVGIFLAFGIGLLIFFILYVATLHEHPSKTLLQYLPLAGGFVLIIIVGLADDFSNMRARLKLVFQLAAAILVTGFGYAYRYFDLPGFDFSFSLSIFGYAFTVFWIVGMSNAMNLIDGMDGLAGGISSIAALFIGVISLIHGDSIIALFAFILFASSVGFLVFNFPPAKIFMGDSGSLFLGFVIAVLPLLKRGGPSSTYTILTVFSLMMIPILDTLDAIIRRRKKRIPFYHADQNHLHHKCLRLGFSNKKILLLVYSLTALNGIGALLWGIFDHPLSILILFGCWAAVIGFFIIMCRKNSRKNGGSETQINDIHKSQ